MRIGVMLGYQPWFAPREQVELAVLADELGLDTAWIAESYGQDASVMLSYIAGLTTQIRLGSAVSQIPARQPTTTAMTAATLDRMSNGRHILGLGLSGPQVSEGWYGVPFTSPLGRTKEYIQIVRSTLAGEHVRHHGKHWSIPLQEGGMGLGKPLKMVGSPVQDWVPIYLGVSGPATTRQAGEIADGWLPFLFHPSDVPKLTERFLEGVHASGRTREDVSITPVVPTAIAETLAEARELLRPILALYLGGMGAREKNFYVEIADRYGHGDEARACQDLFLAGNIDGARAVLTDPTIDTFTIAATPDTLGRRVAEFAEAGIDELAVMPFGDRPEVLRQLATLDRTDQNSTRITGVGA